MTFPIDVQQFFTPNAVADARIQNYSYFRSFYSGDQYPDGSRDKVSQRTDYGPGARNRYPQVVANYARTLIRKTASYTISQPVRFNVADATTANAATIEKILNDQLDSMSAYSLDFQQLIESSTIGDAAIKITTDATGAPVIASIDPAQLIIEVDPHRPDLITQVSHTYSCRVMDVPEQWIGSGSDPYQQIEVVEIWREETYAVVIERTPAFQAENPYGWIPYVLLANEPPARSIWGQSDLVDLDPICRELNRELTNFGRIMEISGWPIIVLENILDSDEIRVGPGQKWELPADAKAYALDLLGQGGMTHHANFIETLYRTIHDISETPRTSFGDSGRALSGVALEVEIQPLVQKVRRKRSRLERYYYERNYRLLDLLAKYGGLSGPIGSSRDTVPEWPAILPTDESETIANAILLTNQTKPLISVKTAMGRIGVTDADGEMAEIAAETPEPTETESQQTDSVSQKEPPTDDDR